MQEQLNKRATRFAADAAALAESFTRDVTNIIAREVQKTFGLAAGPMASGEPVEGGPSAGLTMSEWGPVLPVPALPKAAIQPPPTSPAKRGGKKRVAMTNPQRDALTVADAIRSAKDPFPSLALRRKVRLKGTAWARAVQYGTKNGYFTRKGAGPRTVYIVRGTASRATNGAVEHAASAD